MRFLFDDHIADFEALRTTGYAASGGADLGEVLVATSGLRDAQADPWWHGWSVVADSLQEEAQTAVDSGRYFTAAGSYLRAANYYRNAEFFLHLHRDDPRITRTSAQAVEMFRRFAALYPGHQTDLPHSVDIAGRDPRLRGMAITELAIPFDGARLTGWWFTPEPGDAARPTLVALGGFDSTAEELFLAVGRAAVDRGWNCLVFDGPGQGRVLREQGVYFRPDWEGAVGAVIDSLERFNGVDGSRIALLGMSQGGYFAPRAAAFEHRIAALVAWDGVYDASSAIANVLPREALRLLAAGEDQRADELLLRELQHDHRLEWVIGNGMYSFGVESPSALIHAFGDYRLDGGVAEQIQCATLVFDAEDEPFFVGQPTELAAHFTAPHDVIVMPRAMGAGLHCNAGSSHRFHDALFDWLNGTLR